MTACDQMAMSESEVAGDCFPGIRSPMRSLLWIARLVSGLVCLVLALSVLAAVPGLNLLALGYLVDAQRRIAVSGRLRDGVPLLELSPRLGVICSFVLLFLLPIRILATQTNAALIIRSGSPVTSDGMLLTLRVLQWLVLLHVLLSIARGGSVTSFLTPHQNLRWLVSLLQHSEERAQLSRRIRGVLQILQPRRHWLLGFRAAVGAFCWLLIPTGLLVMFSEPGRINGRAGLLSLAGGLLMMPVAAWLPMLQVHQGVTGRFRSIFSIAAARRVIRHAPFSWLITTVLLLYVMSFPLYLTKIRLLPTDAFLILTPFFITLTYPTRALVAWAYHRGHRLPHPAAAIWRWTARILMLPLLAGYSLILFLTPTVSELGRAAPLENHAFLSPIPYAQWGRAGNAGPTKSSPNDK